jgi:hypothetical protein
MQLNNVAASRLVKMDKQVTLVGGNGWLKLVLELGIGGAATGSI